MYYILSEEKETMRRDTVQSMPYLYDIVSEEKINGRTGYGLRTVVYMTSRQKKKKLCTGIRFGQCLVYMTSLQK